ncbi:hypothetical protein [Candidatus Enterococcus courvalinii]|uniref:Uncharacterized protein n=1 Tax=Candidatus Enterococcus courvalinii TaxID=2815329 RepID=A0ABS3I113_9ENTE|nr:hypothetical protein [Enterococcus sp. MSG2901]MBO0482403.1 hypothetical protein [Enterococcus sp. MSG2901]
MVKKLQLLLVASLVWLFAGFNVAKIGIDAYRSYLGILNIVLSILVFLIFWFMIFGPLVKKHTQRISELNEEMQFFLNFFDGKSFSIMAIMILGGLGIRKFQLLPEQFIAIFYSGLGIALFLAGIVFGYNYFNTNRK